MPLHRQIELDMRRRIESGELPSGKALPSTADLAKQIGVHPLTVQKALRRLKNEGLIERTPRVGTFVRGSVEAPALALLFGSRLSDEPAHSHRTILRALQAETAECWSARVYDGLTHHDKGADPADTLAFATLRRDSQAITFKAVIGVGMGDRVWDKIDALRTLPYAWLAVSSTRSDIGFDLAHFARTAVLHFASRKRRSIAYLRTFSPWSWSRGDRQVFLDAAAECGMDPPEVHDLDNLGEFTIDEHIAYDRMSAIVQTWSRTQWPEAVVVSDDILMRSLALALLNAGDARARQLDLLTWANDGVRFKYGLSTARYEIPIGYCARRLKVILERRMDGKEPLNGQELVQGRIVQDD